jgi:hypothetical protein
MDLFGFRLLLDGQGLFECWILVCLGLGFSFGHFSLELLVFVDEIEVVLLRIVNFLLDPVSVCLKSFHVSSDCLCISQEYLNGNIPKLEKDNAEMKLFKTDAQTIRRNMERLQADRDRIKQKIDDSEQDYLDLINENEKL